MKNRRTQKSQSARPQKGAQRRSHNPINPKSQNPASAGDGWLFGRHAVESALTAARRQVHEVHLAASARDVAAFQQRFPLVKVHTTSRTVLDSMFPQAAHNGLAARVGSLPQPSVAELLATNPTLLVVLDHVTDPHNVGAILRSCAAFGVQGLLVTDRHSANLTPTVAKAAAGGLEVVPFVTIGNLAQTLDKLKSEGFTVIGLAGESPIPVTQLDYTGKTCLVMGSEGEGLRDLTRKICDELVHIPMAPGMESLNVSVATGITLATVFQARQKPE